MRLVSATVHISGAIAFSLNIICLAFLCAVLGWRHLLSLGLPDVFFAEELSFLTWLAIGASLCSIICAVVVLRSDRVWRRFLLATASLVLVAPLVGVTRYWAWPTLPYIYTPPALTPENFPVYNECIEVIRNHHKEKFFTYWLQAVYLDNPSRVLADDSLSMKEKEKALWKMRGGLGDDYWRRRQELEAQFQKLSEQLLAVGCVRLHRDDDMVLFYKHARFRPPTGPGVLYSLEGKNPNKADNRALRGTKPFFALGGNWYVSRHLMLTGGRATRHVSTPIGLFDHSRKLTVIIGDPNI